MTKFLRVWDLLLIGLLVSPLVSGSLFLNTMNTILTVEIVPADQATVPIPSVGDIVEVYGTWVRDQHIFGQITWNEIHPAVFIRNNRTGLEGGTAACRMLENVHDPERLSIIDSSQPCRWAHGTVEYKFQWSDGDWHLDLALDPEDRYLMRGGIPLIPVYLIPLQGLLVATTAGFGITYILATILDPERTLLGRAIKRLLKG